MLRSAQMLDAGAYGLVLILDGLGLVLADEESQVSVGAGTIAIMDSLSVTDAAHPARGESLSRPEGDTAPEAAPRTVSPHPASAHPTPAPAAPAHTAIDGEFEVMFIVEHADQRPEDIDAVGATLRERLLQVGDSVVVVGGEDEPGSGTGPVSGTWQVHVHTDVPLEALGTAHEWTQRQVVVRCLPNQVAARAHGAQPQHGVVACTSSPGLVTDLARSGAVVVLRGDVPIGVDDLRRGALETTAAHVVLLPADPGCLSHAVTLVEASLAGGERDLLPALDVVESVSDLHVVAAVSAWVSAPESPDQPGREGQLEGVRAAVQAVRAVTADGRDLPALLACVGELVDDVRSGPDAVLTVLAGDLVSEQAREELAAEAGLRCPGIEVVVLASGRRSSALVLGVDEA